MASRDLALLRLRSAAARGGEETLTVKRYFRFQGDLEDGDTVWVEFETEWPDLVGTGYEGTWPVRVVRLHRGQWSYCALGDDPDHELPDQPLHYWEYCPDEETTAQAFAAAWEEALRQRRGRT